MINRLQIHFSLRKKTSWIAFRSSCIPSHASLLYSCLSTRLRLLSIQTKSPSTPKGVEKKSDSPFPCIRIASLNLGRGQVRELGGKEWKGEKMILESIPGTQLHGWMAESIKKGPLLLTPEPNAHRPNSVWNSEIPRFHYHQYFAWSHIVTTHWLDIHVDFGVQFHNH